MVSPSFRTTLRSEVVVIAACERLVIAIATAPEATRSCVAFCVVSSFAKVVQQRAAPNDG